MANGDQKSATTSGLAAMGLAALGVVFGDIGTSPLYTLKTVIDLAGGNPSSSVVLGVVSLIFWTLVVITTIKYVTIAMRIDNDGEGGILALMALIGVKRHRRPAIVAIGANAQSLTCKTPDVNAWGVGLSAMHIHSGLFLQGAIEGVEYNNAGSVTSAYWGETCGSATAGGTIVGSVATAGNGCNPKANAWWWQLQGGIAKNWTGWGNTVLYGEYSKLYDFGAEIGGRNFTSGTATSTNGFAQMSNVTSSIATVWGIGLVQNFNNAATEWYFAYRNYALEVNSDAVCTRPLNAGIASSATSANSGTACNISDFNLFTTGLRVKF